jgi:cob(I)alamin adenosyltransferase
MATPADPEHDQSFNTPRLTINRVYTKQGDEGKTRLVGGQQVPKDDIRIDSYGTVDELNAFVGIARQTLDETVAASGKPAPVDLGLLGDTLLRVQHELFNLGSILATLPEDVHPRQPRVTEIEVARLEEEMDHCQEVLPTLRSFVLPGGARLNADLHVCRTICRRAERRVVELARVSQVDPMAVQYLNRLSDAFFVWSRWASHLLTVGEILWDPNRAASAQKRSGEPSGG